MEVFDRFWADVVRVWETGILGAGLGAIIAGLLILLVFILTRGLFTRFLLGSLRRLAARTATNLDDMFLEALERPVRFAFVVIGLSIAVQIIGLDPQTLDWVGVLVRSLIAFTIFWALFNIVEPLSFLISRLLARLGVSESAKETLRGFFIRLLKFVIFALGVLIQLPFSNMWLRKIMAPEKRLATRSLAARATAMPAKPSPPRTAATLKPHS